MLEDKNLSQPLASDKSAETPAAPPNPPRRGRSRLRWVLGGCGLIVVLCIGVSVAGVVILVASGVLSGPHGDSDTNPNWSPDGHQIVFVSDRDGNDDIYIMGADGTKVLQLSKDPFARLYFIRSPDDYKPSWSPDGRHIAFVSGRDNQMMSFLDADIFVMDIDGSHIVNLGLHLSIENSPVWSPDGSHIAFASDKDDPGGDLSIYVMKADGTNVIQLTEGVYPAWSPDGSHIAFTSVRDGDPDIYVMKADGTNVIQLTNDPEYDSLPTWSPDSSQIAFQSLRDGDLENIYVMGADGANVKRLTDNPAADYTPVWSPDGSQIAFVSRRDGDPDIYVMEADGSNVIQLTGKP